MHPAGVANTTPSMDQLHEQALLEDAARKSTSPAPDPRTPINMEDGQGERE